MILFTTASDLTKYLKTKSESGYTIGFVPTMGALHAGHLSLIESSKKNSGLTVSSIFINPTQFNNPGDFAKYPVTLEKDILALEQAGSDVLFLPPVSEVYPGGTEQLIRFDLGHLETILEGYYRPGHFQGVCQVMKRLLEIVMPTTLFLGRKDYQQCMVISKLISLCGWDIQLNIIPTLREDSGLAMSSRNMRLSETDKQKAAVIYRSLLYLKQQMHPGDLTTQIAKGENMIREAGFTKIDYVTIADATTLDPVTHWNGQTPLIGLVAAFIGEVRLIDNMPLTGSIR
jgi:pantoate--beta-alanine ligase